jgi:PAS domain S-box-containing protein
VRSTSGAANIQSEEEFLLGERQYQTLWESVPDFIVRYDLDLRFIYVNPAWEKAIGLPAAEVIGVAHTGIAWGSRSSVDEYTKKLRITLETGAAQVAEFTWINTHGVKLFLAFMIVPEYDQHGKIVGVLAMGHDITERKEAGERTKASGTKNVKAVSILEDITERRHAELQIIRLNQDLQKRAVALEAANKELDAFAYTVSHDLRTPLRHIDGFLELLQREAGTALNETSRYYMDTISESAAKMSLLIDDLLSFSRMGRHAYSMQQIEMGPLVRDVIRELEPDTAGRTIEWRIGDLPSVNGDERMLRIVLTNLISNALKYTRTLPQARIEIGSQNDQDSESVIFVRDNGVGFDMAYAEKLFGVFQRMHRAEEFEGTGIGLASVRRIIARHGGRTWAQAEPDQGAAFYFALPRTWQ